MAIVNVIDSAFELEQEFKRFGRENNFSPAGLRVLFDYLDNLSEEIGEDIKLDVIALCCEYNESSIEEIINNYNMDVSYADGDEDEIKSSVEEYLQYKTSVCGEVNGRFVYVAF